MIGPRSESDFLVEKIPNATLAVVPAAGHLGCLDNPTAFNEAIGKFLDTQR